MCDLNWADVDWCPFSTEPSTQHWAVRKDDPGDFCLQRGEEKRDRSKVIKCHGAKSPGSLEEREGSPYPWESRRGYAAGGIWSGFDLRKQKENIPGRGNNMGKGLKAEVWGAIHLMVDISIWSGNRFGILALGQMVCVLRVSQRSWTELYRPWRSTWAEDSHDRGTGRPIKSQEVQMSG